jgi:hypothetical protein
MSRPRGTRGRFVSKAMITNAFSEENPRACQVCGVTETTQWRSGPRGESLCNADGIRAARAERTARVRARHHRFPSERTMTASTASGFPESSPSEDQFYSQKIKAMNTNATPYLIGYAGNSTSNINTGSNVINYYYHYSKRQTANTGSRVTKIQRHRQSGVRKLQSVSPNHTLGPSLFRFKPAQRPHGPVSNYSSGHRGMATGLVDCKPCISFDTYPLLDVNKESRNCGRDFPREILHPASVYASPQSSGSNLPCSPVSSSPDYLRTSSCHNVCSLSNLLN